MNRRDLFKAIAGLAGVAALGKEAPRRVQRVKVGRSSGPVRIIPIGSGAADAGFHNTSTAAYTSSTVTFQTYRIAKGYAYRSDLYYDDLSGGKA